MKLNASRNLLGKAAALDDHKEWVMVLASDCVDCVAPLVQAGLKNNCGVKTLIYKYGCAAEMLYKLKGYSSEDLMRSIVMLRLGRAHVTEFAHCSLSLPSITTIQHNTVLQPLIVSPSAPTMAEIEEKIMSCYAGLTGITEGISNSGTSDASVSNSGTSLLELYTKF